MKYLETEEEKKSFAFTTILFVLMFLLFFYLGLSYMDPPPEKGIAVNFGTTESGSGEVQPTEAIQSAPEHATPQPAASSDEEVISQDIEEAVVMKEAKKEKNKNIAKEEAKPKPVESPKPSKSTSDVLSSFINGPKSDGKATGSEGNDNLPGDKGSRNGDPYASSYYGNGGGSGGGRGWGLNGRKLSSSGKVVQKCNEYGTVVVQITVNRQGNVIGAKYTKGTTNTNPCLIEPAIATAKKYKWQPDSNAPETQIGFITVNFKLSE